MQCIVGSAEALGYTVIDLNEVMRHDFQKTGRRFEFSFDDHWNRYCHRITAKAVLEVLKINVAGVAFSRPGL